LKLKDVTGVTAVTLIGSATPLKFQSGAGEVKIQLPDLPEDLRAQPAWVLKISR
jgi:hypothetical protein